MIKSCYVFTYCYGGVKLCFCRCDGGEWSKSTPFERSTEHSWIIVVDHNNNNNIGQAFGET